MSRVEMLYWRCIAALATVLALLLAAGAGQRWDE